MDRRTHDGWMDWEYHSQPPVDPSSPFTTFSQTRPTSSVMDSPTKFASNNPFAFPVASRGSPAKPQNQPRPPASSFFNPQLQSRQSAPAFRNPAFTTPQKRPDERVFSEFSGVDSSPAMTDTSEVPAETPEIYRAEDDVSRLTLTSSPSKQLFKEALYRNHASGRGEIPRGNRDKVRKRKRLQSDRDVGSVRYRLPHASDDSDSDWEEGASDSVKGSKKGKTRRGGWFNNFLSAVSDHPSAPAILSKWLQLGVNIILLGIVLFGIFGLLVQIRSDLSHASEKARAAIANEMSICADNYSKNNCSPRANRPPALDGPCNEWETCMHQDPSAVKVVQISARNVAEIMNEFVGVLTFKTWGFILSLFLVTVVASNVGFGFLRESTLSHSAKPHVPLQSPPVVPPVFGSAAAHNPQQAYIWAPIGRAPRDVRRNLFASDAADSDASPDFKAIMPPETPSGRRSPSKGDRARSPTKGF
ncbi:Di-sulfide bridge nucleocytoplasmic transport domain-containing protein [Chaetomium strumarium]|uniref:Di-sulfide bridge nucleocytoplasmic transport domain-containing protein n=1 Tax=Chaetomium strumarium TaxID=1170767 RepID=A0AAJ0H3B2_9PEZI|nr:Di-sulfide bridge nucleocytoplasmic transport domain-containing protein [Chaetomium strumarium]